MISLKLLRTYSYVEEGCWELGEYLSFNLTDEISVDWSEDRFVIWDIILEYSLDPIHWKEITYEVNQSLQIH